MFCCMSAVFDTQPLTVSEAIAALKDGSTAYVRLPLLASDKAGERLFELDSSWLLESLEFEIESDRSLPTRLHIDSEGSLILNPE